jgi:hypothetical protein
MPRKYSLEVIMKALRAHRGLVSLAADSLGCSRATIYNYVQASPEVAAIIAEERERLVDLAEEGLYHHLIEHNPWAIAFVLRTLGKGRGYSDKGPVGDPPDRVDAQEWQHIQHTLLLALAAYPDAKQAVVRALNGNRHGPTNGDTPGA